MKSDDEISKSKLKELVFEIDERVKNVEAKSSKKYVKVK